ncbi:MAG: hypothetical protein DMG21_20645, partial [Acidobacteria bacterium]
MKGKEEENRTMMKFENPQGHCGSRATEHGQVSIFVIVALGIFLLGLVGFGVDMTNMWFHRQTAQAASDAACQAGIMDEFDIVGKVTLPAPGAGFTPGTAFQCSDPKFAAATPCWYASHNGYTAGTGLAPNADSNDEWITFPGANAALPPCCPGCTPPLITSCLPTSIAPYPLLQVDLTDRFKLTFASLVSGQRTMDVKAKSICALVLEQQPVPIVVMNQVCPYTLNSQGSGGFAVLGGPPLSVQVNSSNPTAIPATTGTIDLSKGGPNFSGSNLGVLGGVGTAPITFLPGTTGGWVFPHQPITDPFYNLPVPARPTTVPASPPDDAAYNICMSAQLPLPPGLPFSCVGKPLPCAVPGPYVVSGVKKCSGFNGCPDQTQACVEYTPGLYTTPIEVKAQTAIFDPGVYYITGTNTDGNCPGMPSAGCFKPATCRASLVLLDKSIIRPSTVIGTPPNNIGGTMFYFTSDLGAGHYGSIFIGSNSGKTGGARKVDDYGVTPAGSTASLVQCPGGAAIDPKVGLPPTMSGNIFLAPCTGPYGTNDTAGLA